MKTRILIGLLLAAIVLLSGCAEKECKTAADCMDKTCSSVDCKDNRCVYTLLDNCCGNEICEVGEVYPDCVADCPNCDDKNECTVDEYDYHLQECVNTKILDVVCCGNGVCELGEDYETCTRDCPNCDDANDCTTDSYDYHAQECVNEALIPCCGNEICDEGAETHTDCPADCPDCDDSNDCTKDSFDYQGQECVSEVITPCCGNEICDEGVEDYSSCSADCPNCDDSNKMTGDSFNYETQECEYVTYYLYADFDDGTVPWSQDPRFVVADGAVSKDAAAEYAYTSFGDRKWTDYKFRSKVKLEQGFVELSVRIGSAEEGTYGISIFENKLTLYKDKKPLVEFGSKAYSFASDKFYDIGVEVKASNIKVYVNDVLQIDYTDTDNPILSGNVGLYISDKAYINEIIVEAP